MAQIDLKKKKEDLVKQFNQTEQQINQLLFLREQIRGQLMLIKEQEGEKKKNVENRNK